MSSFASGYIKYINHIEQINDAVFEDIPKMINEIEESYHDHLKSIASHIVNHKTNVKVCMLAGPSSSGKTTTAHCLQEYMRDLGRIVYIISLDDFYLPKKDIPCLQDGTKDFDTVNALNIEGIKNCISSILSCGELEVPKYNFTKGKPEEEKRFFKIEENDLVILEGIHALNPIFTDFISTEHLVKLYVSVKQGIEDENGMVINPNELRLTRRLVRDVRFRGCGAEETLSMWNMVNIGEDKYIRPYRFTADYTVNSIHLYEPCVLRKFAIPMLRAIERYSPYYKNARALEAKLMRFEVIDASYVPKTSILREFIGNEE